MRNRRLLMLVFLGHASLVLGESLVPAQPRDFAYLGIQTAPRDPAKPEGGLVVTYVSPSSPALEMGLRAGDEILTLNDLVIRTQEQLVTELRKENINAKVRFRVRREGAEMKVEGRIGSYQRTMQAYQDHLRKERVGKPLAPPPGLAWWSAERKAWDEGGKAWDSLQGKLGVVFSFDDCSVCLEKRYGILTKTKLALDATPARDHVVFLGLFFAEPAKAKGRAENQKLAAALLEASPPSFPIAVAFYPKDASTPLEREGQYLLHNHGIVLLDKEGNISFLQTHEPPGYDFSRALQAALTKLGEGEGAAGSDAGKSAPPAPAGGSPPGKSGQE